MTIEILDDLQLEPTPSAVSSDLNGEFIIFDVQSGNYFGLSGVGALAWQMLQGSTTPAAIKSAILAEYDVTPEDCSRDLDRLLTSLIERGLIVSRALAGESV